MNGKGIPGRVFTDVAPVPSDFVQVNAPKIEILFRPTPNVTVKVEIKHVSLPCGGELKRKMVALSTDIEKSVLNSFFPQ